MKVIKGTVGFIVGALIMYLTGVFANANFDITTWSELNRGFIGFMMLLIGAFGLSLATEDIKRIKI